ncbi:acetoacetate decarboxylase family protein [Anaeroselena agilis]|uniref:Acetoacetate decarboxylase family protein n=1 Tax=Anaeroselena agilis TaxID=3063788 RepID=A0ABU3NSG5_9FIRM|nr:acetoacetate decarboxylase family protein [Selenomonadales bacterium 4137-cl]
MFRFDERLSYRMPAHFGGTEGSGCQSLPYDDVSSIMISYRTDEAKLSQYVPDEFEILEPVVLVNYSKCLGIRWMGGGHYSMLAVMTPARHSRSGVEGAYILVIWENKTAPILGGREETGMPKIYADIPDYHQLDGRFTVHASHEGRAFVELELETQKALTAEELAGMNANGRMNQLGWRYIPNVGRPGAALSHAVLYPADTTYRSGGSGVGRIVWTKASPALNPLQHHIINALTDLPVLEYRQGLFAKSALNLRGDLIREL